MTYSIFNKAPLFKRRKPKPNPDTDPIPITHGQDPSLDEDEMILHTTIDPQSINKKDDND